MQVAQQVWIVAKDDKHLNQIQLNWLARIGPDDRRSGLESTDDVVHHFSLS